MKARLELVLPLFPIAMSCTAVKKTNPVESEWLETSAQHNMSNVEGKTKSQDNSLTPLPTDRLKALELRLGAKWLSQTVYSRCQSSAYFIVKFEGETYPCHSGHEWGVGVDSYSLQVKKTSIRFAGLRAMFLLNVIVSERFGASFAGKLGSLGTTITSARTGWTYGRDISLYVVPVRAERFEWRISMNVTEDMYIPKKHGITYNVKGLGGSAEFRWSL